MKNFLVYIIASFAVFACNKIDDSNNTEHRTSIQIESSTTILYSDSSVYAKFFDENAEREIGYYSTKANVSDRDIFGFDRSLLPEEKSTRQISPFFANTIQLSKLGNTENTQLNAMCDFNFDDLFGKRVRFTSGGDQNKSASETDVDMYVPYLIDINYPVASATELQPLCPYNDLLVEWNTDVNNNNGVAVIVEWDGDMVGSDKRAMSIRSIDVVADKGSAILNPELFKDIPDLAMINITLLRGNIDIVEIENTAVKIYAASNSSIAIVLAKEPI